MHARLLGVLAAAIPEVLCFAGAAPAGEAKGGDYIKVEVRGTLHAGIMAIGGETTGTVIQSDGVRWELDLGKNPKWRALAKELNGKKAVVAGTLAVRPGVEIPKRWIVTVTSLKQAGRGEAQLSVGKDGRLSFLGRQVGDEEFAKMLKNVVAKEPEGVALIIRADRRVKTGHLQEVMRLAQQSGVESFRVVAVDEGESD